LSLELRNVLEITEVKVILHSFAGINTMLEYIMIYNLFELLSFYI